MANHPTQADWDAFDGMMYEFYRASRSVGFSAEDAMRRTKHKFGEDASWCEVQYQDDIKRGK